MGQSTEVLICEAEGLALHLQGSWVKNVVWRSVGKECWEEG